MFATLDDHLPSAFGVLLCRHDPDHFSGDEMLRLLISGAETHLHRSRRGRIHPRDGVVDARPKLRSTLHRSPAQARASLAASWRSAERAGFVPLTGPVPLGPGHTPTLASTPQLLAAATQDAWHELDPWSHTQAAELAVNPRALVLLPGLDDGHPAPGLVTGSFTRWMIAGEPTPGGPALVSVPRRLAWAISALCPYAAWAPRDLPTALFLLSLLESYTPSDLTRARFHTALSAVGPLAS